MAVCGTRRTASTTTSCACPTARDPAQGALAGRPAADLRGDGLRRRRRGGQPAVPGAARDVRRTLRRRGAAARQPARSQPGGSAALALVDEQRLRRILATMLDEDEFLGPHGIRAISRRHLDAPCVFDWGGQEYRVGYLPAESDTGMFGGNSNWRGPVWFPMNLVILRGLLQLHRYYGDGLTVECPTGSGRQMTLLEVADGDRRRLTTHVPARRGRPPAGVRRHREVPVRSALARPAAVPRVLPRRQRRRASAPAIRPAGPGPSRCCSCSRDGQRARGGRDGRRRRLSAPCACPPAPRSTRSTPRSGCNGSAASAAARSRSPRCRAPRGTRSRRCRSTPCG